MKRILMILSVVAMFSVAARAEDEFVSQMECIDGIWYETFMPSHETVPANYHGEQKNCAKVLGVGENEVYARVCRNENVEIVPITTDITIPSHVTIGGKEYDVIATGKNSLGKITNGATVTLPPTIKWIGAGSLWAKREEMNTGGFSPTVIYDEAYIKLPETIVVIEANCFSGLQSKQSVYLPNVSVLDCYALFEFTVAKLKLGSKLTATREYAIPHVKELAFEEGDEEALKWDTQGITYFCSNSICYADLKEFRLPRWENLKLGDGSISSCDNLERVVFPDIKILTYDFGVDYIGVITPGFRGIFIEHCPKLSEVVCLGVTPPCINYDPEFKEYAGYWGETGEFEFMDNIDQCVLKVPVGSEELYRADPVWGKFKTIYGFENGDYTSIVLPEMAEASEDESTPVYHNLQGMRVEHPVHGQLYIRTIGSRTDKVVY